MSVNGKTVFKDDQIPGLYTVQLKEFAEAIRDNQTPIASGEEVRKTMMVLDEIRPGFSRPETGRPVPGHASRPRWP